jgi:7-cyano-7-deazaguanine synthase in queuosine biosynthesis
MKHLNKNDSLIVCYQVLEEDLLMLLNFMDFAGIQDQSSEIYESISALAELCTQKKAQLSMHIQEKKGNVVKVDFTRGKKEDG